MAHTPYFGPDGERWPSVTEVIDIIAKPGLSAWMAKVGTDEAKKQSDAAKATGKSMHDDMEAYCKDQTHVVTDPLAKAIVEQFCTPYMTGVLTVEQKVVNNKHRYHGTYDGIITVKDMPITKKSKTLFTGDILVDWKSANDIYNTNGLQLGGYWGAGSGLPTSGLIVRVDKESHIVYWKVFTKLPKHYKTFVNARKVYDFMNRKGEWKRT